MDWDLAIKRNSEALKGIIAALFAMLGLVGTDTVSRISHPLHSAVLLVLRPAESAVRRLIVIAARGLVVKLSPSRPMPKGTLIGKGDGSRLPAFPLYDTRKYFPELSQRRIRYAKHPPRILFLTPESRIDDLWRRPQPGAAPAPNPDGLVNGQRLSLRLQASSRPLMTFPARPSAWPAGGHGGRP